MPAPAAPAAVCELTPVEQVGDYLLKRDDLFQVAGVRGGKVRTCMALASKATKGLVTAGSRSSPQACIVAHVAKHLGLPCRVHVPSGKLLPELELARQAGAVIVQHKAGYNSVIVARARQDAAALGWTEIPFGMQCWEAVAQTAKQVANIPRSVQRIVVPVGSGMSLAGVLNGLVAYQLTHIRVLGVKVGADPLKRLDEFGPLMWERRCLVTASGYDYHEPAAETQLEGLQLDPHYEAKCIPFLQPGDLFWVVGLRKSEDKCANANC